jgi:F-type H+-transporting ATPase subunit b
LGKLGILLPNLIFYLVNFFIMLWLLNRFLYPPIVKLFNERRERIRDSLAEAERVKEEAAAERARLESQIAEERRTSQERLREAVARSEEAAGRRLAEASAEADQILARARVEADQARQQALVGLQGEIADLALRAAAKVLREGIDDQGHRALVDRFLREELGDLA